MALTHFVLATAAVITAMASAQNLPLLSTIATVPELSNFSSVINVTGGTQLNPALEERFNSILDSRRFTALAPTNNAFSKISTALLGALTAAPAYPILEAIIRTHVAEGLLTSANITSTAIEAIEGFQLSAVATAGTDGVILVNDQARIVAVDEYAENGVVHQIDQLLNPFTAYFGVSNATAPPQVFETGSSVADILLTDERLSDAREVLLAVQPDLIMNRLTFARPDGKPQIFAAPSSDAFAAAPAGTLESSVAPSNQALSSLLFSFGLLSMDAPLANFNFSAGPISIANVFTGIIVNATQKEGGAIFLNNAAVQDQICGSNGCIVIIDRILDPLYLGFGPVDRSS